MLRLVFSVSEETWDRLESSLVEVGIYRTKNLRLIVEGILWRLRSGAPWRDLPESLGPWSSVYNQFNRWSQRGIWRKIFALVCTDPDNEWNFIDATIVKAHQHSSGVRKGEESAIGKSRGGLTTKIHMLADANGNPLSFEITPGQVSDFTVADELIETSNAENLITDKGYDSERIRAQARDKGICPIIPRRKNSVQGNPEFDPHLYRLRHLVENLFARLKHFRALATRYDKLKRNCTACWELGCILLWLKL